MQASEDSVKGGGVSPIGVHPSATPFEKPKGVSGKTEPKNPWIWECYEKNLTSKIGKDIKNLAVYLKLTCRE